MKGLLVLILFGIIVAAGVLLVHYAPVCVVEYACPVTRDLRGRVLEASCLPQAKEYQNAYVALLFSAPVAHDGLCTDADRAGRR